MKGAGATVVGVGAIGTVSTLLAVLTLSVACEKQVNLAPAASSLASAAAPPAGASVMRFVVVDASTTSIEIDAPKEKFRAATKGGTGTLIVDLANLTSSRGEVKMDLSTIVTSTFNDAADNASQTTHARTWLEVGDGEEGKLDEATKAANRYAVYAIRSIENASATDLANVPPTKDGESGDELRTVTLTTKGELLIHGHKVDREADVEVRLRYPPGASAHSPKSIAISTKKPLHVVIAEHDVKPRDGFGKIAKKAFHLLGTKVGDNAYIALDVRAKPQS
jgi:hypothetical protein